MTREEILSRAKPILFNIEMVKAKTAVINYIKSNPNTTTSDVITKFSELLGIFPQN